MAKTLALTGNEAAAYAMMQINPDVVAAYPITPQTALMQKFADFVSDGDVDTELILVESEHSAMSATLGASAGGARAMTATAANGLALMWEIVYITASNRLPIVMPVVNRALSAPINILCDHSDTMGCRDSGWIQIYSENAQEAYENTIQAVRIAEHPDVFLPVMVTLDGFIISHGMEDVRILEKREVQKFVGEYKPHYPLLDPNHPVSYGPIDFHDYYFEHKKPQVDAMESAKDVILQVGREFGELSGQKYGFFDAYRVEDAEIVAVILSSTAGTARPVVDELRQKGIKAGLLKLRVFRPFPAEELAAALKGKKAIAVLDRAISFGAHGGPLFMEICSALFNAGEQIPTLNFLYGLGGRAAEIENIEDVYARLQSVAKQGKVDNVINYLNLRE
jgi:pyruvate ferredoxin oxidoreductase alpha subunit